MKKILMVFLILIATIALTGCNSGEKIEVEIINEAMTTNELILDVILTKDFENVGQIEEIAYSIASLSYEKNFETIGASSYSMVIHLYNSQNDFDNSDITYGTIIFDINKTLETPGLSLNQNHIVLD